MWLLYNNSNNNNNNYHQKIKKYNNKNSPTMFLISFCLFNFCTLFLHQLMLSTYLCPLITFCAIK